jgi:hypothetical protein
MTCVLAPLAGLLFQGCRGVLFLTVDRIITVSCACAGTWRHRGVLDAGATWPRARGRGFTNARGPAGTARPCAWCAGRTARRAGGCRSVARAATDADAVDRSCRARPTALSDVPDLSADGSAGGNLVMQPKVRLSGGVFPGASSLVANSRQDHATAPTGPASGGEPTMPVPVGSRRLGTFLTLKDIPPGRE